MKFGKVFSSSSGKDKSKDKKSSGRLEKLSEGITVTTEERVHKQYVYDIFHRPVLKTHNELHSHSLTPTKTLTTNQKTSDEHHNIDPRTSAISHDRIPPEPFYRPKPDLPLPYRGAGPAQLSTPEAAWSSRFSDHSTRPSAYAPSHTNTTTAATATPPPPAALPPPLQFSRDADTHARGLSPLPEDAVDPDSFDLTAPPRGADLEDASRGDKLEPLERRAQLLFSRAHLRIIISDLKLLRRFGVFLMEHRPQHVPLLVYHLDARKALAAVRYANAVAGTLARRVEEGEGGVLGFTREAVGEVESEVLVRKAEESFRVLADEDVPAWITSVWMRAVEVSIRRRINGSLPTQLREWVFLLILGLKFWLFCGWDESADDERE